MDERSDSTPQPQPQPRARRPRRKRPNGRWSNPASPLQAARFALRLNGRVVVAGIRAICPGHGGEPCRIDVAKLSDHETGHRRPGLTHVEAFARFYQKSPEELGLIKWRNEPPPPASSDPAPAPDPAPDPDPEAGKHHADCPADACLLATLAAHDLPLSYDAPVDHLLAHVLTQTLAVSAITAHLLRTTIDDPTDPTDPVGPTTIGAFL